MKLFSRAGNPTRINGFAIIELLVVIVVLGILAAIIIVGLKPGEIVRQSRDTTRLSDLQTLNKSISVLSAEGITSFGTTNTVYVSLPDSNSDCSGYSLPTLPTGWSYACRPSTTYQSIDGTGWIPLDFTSTSVRLSTLPVDPVNSEDDYYTYIASSEWELNAKLESTNNIMGGDNDKVSSDGGDDPTRLEIGNNLALAPWSFEFAAFPITTLNSGLAGWGRNNATEPGITINSDSTATNYVRMAGYGWYIWQENTPFNPESTYKMSCKFRQVTDPSAGGKGVYCGWNGVGANGTTLVNVSGIDTNSSQHYHVVSNATAVAGAGWVTYTGYTKGWGTPGGSGGTCPNLASPCKMHADTRYIRPMFIVNYANGDGTADIDSITITKM